MSIQIAYRQIIRATEQSQFAQPFINLELKDLENVLLDFQALYSFDDGEVIQETLIPSENWITFGQWAKSEQSAFLAYLTCKIAFLQVAEVEPVIAVNELRSLRR